MFGFKRRTTFDSFVQELVYFSLSQLPTSPLELALLWNERVKSGDLVDIRRYELSFLISVEVWHAIFTARSRGKLTDHEWQELNGRFLASMMQSFSAWPVNLWSSVEPLDAVFQKRLVEYREATAGVDAMAGIAAMCSVYANHCSEDGAGVTCTPNEKLLVEAYGHLVAGTNFLVKKISGLKFIG